MKKITFFGSGVELEKYGNNLPEINSVLASVSKKYDEVLFGGTNIGIMGKFATCAKENGLKISSILPKWFMDKYEELVFSRENLVLVDSLAERKKVLCQTDAVLCYPGGVGTLDELFDLLARISLEEIEPIPIIIYNFERFYSPILLQIESGIRTGIIKKEVMDNIHTFEQVDQLDKILGKLE